MKKNAILVFEDNPKFSDELRIEFEKVCKREGIPIYSFEPSERDKSLTFEENIRKEIMSKEYGKGNIGLILSDRDLSGVGHYSGLSEASVSKVAEELSIPICYYAQGVEDDDLEKIQRWSEFKIFLNRDKGAKNIVHDAMILYEGFENIKTSFEKIFKRRLFNESYKSLSMVLAKIIEQDHLADRIALYGSGDQKFLPKIFLDYTAKKITEVSQEATNKFKNIEKRIPRVLGYWLWDSILRFPGIVVNEVAAASYLNIDTASFREKSIQKKFFSAVYNGPFAEIRTLWWRHKLNEILAKEDFEDGLELIKKKTKLKANSCKCSVDNKAPAGFYCMITKKPVSERNSHSNVAWFPAGADLTRISKPEFDELEPWLGLY